MMNKALQALSVYFGYESFRKGQKETIEKVLEGHDTLCIMPTGEGKSVCYQIPAVIQEGTAIVITPLISLMKDQVDALQLLGIRAVCINSTMTMAAQKELLEEISCGLYKLVYVSPERLMSEDFRKVVSQMNISLVAIDEAHCISEWGHDFRPSYQQIAPFIKMLQGKPTILALTATATPEVQQDISDSLGIPLDNKVMTTFKRNNLSFTVVKGEDRDEYLIRFVKKNEKETGIVYVATRKSAETLQMLLKQNGIRATLYHGGLSAEERSQAQEDFLHEKVQVMVATNAFGMGINKSNVRFLIHYQLPKNIESYYQEAGRAGRDGVESECILLFNGQDVQLQKYLIQNSTEKDRSFHEYEKLQQMVDYCHTETCLRNHILEYFGESTDGVCGKCANCVDDREAIDVTKETQMVLSCIIRTGRRFGKNMISQVLTGSRNKKLLQFGFDRISTYNLMGKHSLKEVNLFIDYLIATDYIEIKQGEFPYLDVGRKGISVLKNEERVWKKREAAVKQVSPQHPLFQQLREIRRQIAEKEGVPPFMIFSDMTLMDMCTNLPVSPEAFLKVKGVGEQKSDKYGTVFIQAILSWREEVEEKSYGADMVASLDPNKPEKSHIITYQYYQEGKTITEIAKLRGLKERTIEQHFLLCDKEGLEIAWGGFFTKEQAKQIAFVMESTDIEHVGLRGIKELLPEQITYFQIQAYRLYQAKIDHRPG
ncbi:MAG: DNA helicase RecQ [Bacillus sp. (in: firmicutes)]